MMGTDCHQGPEARKKGEQNKWQNHPDQLDHLDHLDHLAQEALPNVQVVAQAGQPVHRPLVPNPRVHLLVGHSVRRR